jgi:hypothetical protein
LTRRADSNTTLQTFRCVHCNRSNAIVPEVLLNLSNKGTTILHIDDQGVEDVWHVGSAKFGINYGTNNLNNASGSCRSHAAISSIWILKRRRILRPN